MLILDLWGIDFHAVVVFGLGKDFLFKSILGRCVLSEKAGKVTRKSKLRYVFLAQCGAGFLFIYLFFTANLNSLHRF